MESISLDNSLKLSFETLAHNLRLAVLKNNEIWVCRNEKLTNLLSFLEVDKGQLFKGRLQLFKSDREIDIQVKNKFIATVSCDDFRKVLSKLNSSKPRS